MSEIKTSRDRLRRWWVRLDVGEPYRYVHLFYGECRRPDCRCHEVCDHDFQLHPASEDFGVCSNCGADRKASE